MTRILQYFGEPVRREKIQMMGKHMQGYYKALQTKMSIKFIIQRFSLIPENQTVELCFVLGGLKRSEAVCN